MTKQRKILTWGLSILTIVGFTAIWGDFGTLASLVLIFWLVL